MTPERANRCFSKFSNKFLKVAVIILLSFSDFISSQSSFPPLKVPVLGVPAISDSKPATQPDGTPFTATVFSVSCTVGLEEQYNGNDILHIAVNFVTDTQETLLPESHITDVQNGGTGDDIVTLEEKLITGHLGHSITCRAEAYIGNPPIYDTKYSEYRWFGLSPISDSLDFVSTQRITLNEAEPQIIQLEASFPITTRHCYEQPDQCQPSYTFIMAGTQAGGFGISQCSFNLPAKENDDRKTSGITFNADKTIGTRQKDFQLKVFFQLQTESTIGSIFENYIIDPFPVYIDDMKTRPVCRITGFSNVKNFDSRDTYDTYDNNPTEEFYLLKLDDLGTAEIQVRRRQCNPSVAVMCSCGVIAREGNNILGVNGCLYYNAAPLVVRYLTPDDTESAATIITLSATAWKIVMPSGTEVSISYFLLDGNEGLNIDVYGLNGKSYKGLCESTTDATNYVNYAVPEGKSLFLDQAQCVSGATSPPICSCSKSDSTNFQLVCENGSGVDKSAIVPRGRANCGTSGKRRKRSLRNTDDVEVEPSIVYATPLKGTPSTTPDPPVWPTRINGITEMQANETCEAVMKDAPAYAACSNISSFDLSSYLKICIHDIQVTDSLKSAYIYQMVIENACNYKAEEQVSYESSNNTVIIPPDQQDTLNTVRSKTCPGQCTSEGVKRGTCNTGACTCDAGFGDIDCSLNLNESATITRLLPSCYDYQKLKQSDGLMTILIQGKNLARMGKLACKATMIFHEWVRDVSLEQQYPTKFCSGRVAAFFRIPNLQYRMLYDVSVSVSNDNETFSSSVLYRMYDSSCMTCDQTTKECKLLVGYTWLDDYCFGTVDQSCQSNGFVKYDNTYSTGSKRYSDGVTVQECMSSCCADEECKAIDYDPTSSECRKHTKKTKNVMNTRKSSTRFDQYLIYRNSNEGYRTGAYPETEDPDTCEYDTCGNGGSCYDDGQGHITCACTTGYTGPTCDVDINYCTPDPCENGGICEDGISSYTCTCPPGYSGLSCEDNIDDCNPNPCQHGGTCTDGVDSYTCKCSSSYKGNNCESAITCIISQCSTCVPGNPPRCDKCRPGYGTPTATDQSRCLNCSSKTGCSQCSDLTQCTQCYSNTLTPLKDGSGKCAPCESNCRNCTANGPGKCDSCISGYYLQSTYTCAACSVDNCQTCSNNKCTDCKSGYWFNTSTTPASCSPCGDNCIFCKANPGQCDPGYCKAGFTYRTDTKSCVQ